MSVELWSYLSVGATIGCKRSFVGRIKFALCAWDKQIYPFQICTPVCVYADDVCVF